MENFVERSVIMHAGAKTIPFDPAEGLYRRREHDILKTARSERWNLDHLEREYILAVLEEVTGHQGRAAEVLAETLGVNGRARDDQLEIRAPRQDAVQAAEQAAFDLPLEDR